LKNVREFANSILAKLAEFRISALYVDNDNSVKTPTAQRQNTLSRLRIEYMNTDGAPKSLLSGYETFVMEIALKIAYNQFCCNGCVGRLFVIDEGLDVIDEQNMRDRFPIVLKLLKDYYSSILLISHMENVDLGSVDNVIRIQRADGCSVLTSVRDPDAVSVMSAVKLRK
jgi:DNA repair exonuclease SbcCD ATPase subunit